jgi:hypothetical protein
MTREMELKIGTRASCPGGACGVCSRVIIDPATRTVTHIVVDPPDRRASGRLVPLDLIADTGGEIKLSCTLAEFGNLEPAEETDLTEVPSGGLGPGGMPTPLGVPHPVRIVIDDVVPLGEAQLRGGVHVHAVDGEIGRVDGFLVDPGDHRLTHVLLAEGHLWGHKEVAIPASAVIGVADGIRLSLTKKQVEHLPGVR